METTIKLSDYIRQVELGYISPVKCLSVFKKLAFKNNLDGTKEEIVYLLAF